MKIYGKTLKRLMTMFGVGCLLSALLTSCLKNKNDYYVPPTAYVAFIQASPGEQPLDLYLNNNRVNQVAINYGGGLDYFKAYPGLRTVNIYHAGSMTSIFSDTVRLKENAAYSLFLVKAAPTPGLLLLTDSISRPANGKAAVRFVNVSPDAPAVDLAVKDSAAFITNKAFKGASSFLPKDGNKVYTFEVRDHHTNAVLATLSNVTLNSGLVYTIWFRGLANTSVLENKLTVDIVTNAYYN